MAKKKEVSESLFEPEKLLKLKKSSIDVPYISEGKGGWMKVTVEQWNLTHQRSILDYWADRKKEDDGFDIESKKKKFFEAEEPVNEVE